MSAKLIWKQLVSAVESGSFERIPEVARQFDDEAMSGGEYPESYFNVILGILSDEKLQKAPEVFNFLVDLSPDAERLSQGQLDSLVSTIETNIEKFRDAMLVHAAIDFISRHYEDDKILQVLKTIAWKDIPDKDRYLRMGVSVAVSNHKLEKGTAIKFLRDIGVSD